MNRKNGIALLLVSALAILLIMTLVWSGGDRVGTLRSRFQVLKWAVSSYQADLRELPDSAAALAAYDDRAAEALEDPWRPGERMQLDFNGPGYLVRFENEHARAVIDGGLRVSVEER